MSGQPVFKPTASTALYGMFASLNQSSLNDKAARFSPAAMVAIPYLCLLFGGLVVIGVLSFGLAIGSVGVNQASLTIGHLWMGLVISLLPNLLFALLIGYWLKRKLLVLQTDIEATTETTKGTILKGIPDLLVHIKDNGQSMHVVCHGVANQDVLNKREKAISIDDQHKEIAKRDSASVNLLSI